MKTVMITAIVTLLFTTMGVLVAQPVKPGEDPNYRERFGIGVPVGLYNEDPVYGLDFHVGLAKGFVMRLDAPVITNQYYSKMPVTGLRGGHHWSTMVMPSLGLIWKTPIYLQSRLYIGVTGGMVYDITRERGPFFASRFFGALEVYVMRHWAFFVEMGGCGVVAKGRNIDFSQGVMIIAGQRLYAF